MINYSNMERKKSELNNPIMVFVVFEIHCQIKFYQNECRLVFTFRRLSHSSKIRVAPSQLHARNFLENINEIFNYSFCQRPVVSHEIQDKFRPQNCRKYLSLFIPIRRV